MNIDKKIIKALKSDDINQIHSAFTMAFNRYNKLIYLCISQYIPLKEDVEELLNDTFIKVFNNLHLLKENGNLKYYLATTAKNLAYDFLRKKKVEIVALNEQNVFQQDNYLVSDPFTIISSYLDELELFIVLEHLAYQRSFREIAFEKKLSINTVMTKYRRSMQKLQRNIRKENI